MAQTVTVRALRLARTLTVPAKSRSPLPIQTIHAHLGALWEILILLVLRHCLNRLHHLRTRRRQQKRLRLPAILKQLLESWSVRSMRSRAQTADSRLHTS